MRLGIRSRWWCWAFHGDHRRRTTLLGCTYRDFRFGRVVTSTWAVRCARCAVQDEDEVFEYIPRDPRPPGES